MKTLSLYILVATLAVACLFGCKKDSMPGINPQSGMQIILTDAPGDFDAVYIDIRDVMVSSSDKDESWVSLGGVRPGMYNLLELTNGVDTLIADAALAPGRINQIRLILGDNNYVVVGGQRYPLKTPSAQQSGLKIKFKTDLVAGVIQLVVLDFDVAKSVVEHGNGDYHLKPVIRAFVDKSGGVISGQVVPAVPSVVEAVSPGDGTSAYTSADGRFVLRGLQDGVYTVTITPATSSGYAAKTIANVVVKKGEVSNTGVTVLNP
ncbi:MAG: DUF4382 domain-containing protein [Bacteroidota bacterium]